MMDWETDRNLQFRMAMVMLMLALLPLAFTVSLSVGFNSIVFPVAAALTEVEPMSISFNLPIVLLLTLLGLALAYYKGRDVALESTDARVVSRDEVPEIHDRVQRLAATADMPVPDIALVDSSAPNAFATGRSQSDATIAVTKGLLDTLDDDELDAVLAHELAHIRNRDATVMSIAFLLPTVTFAVATLTYRLLTGVFKSLSYMHMGHRRGGGRAALVVIILFTVSALVTITLSIVFWAASFVLFRLISQYREYAADRGAAAITGDPLALASALETIDGRLSSLPDTDLRELDGGAEALYIASLELPMFDEEDDDTLLSQELFPNSHPPTAERIERLQELAEASHS